MKKVVSCGFNMDTGCVETTFQDSSSISINCTAVEDEYAVNTMQQSELDWLIYNEPHTYVNLILSGEVKAYLQSKPEHTLLD